MSRVIPSLSTKQTGPAGAGNTNGALTQAKEVTHGPSSVPSIRFAVVRRADRRRHQRHDRRARRGAPSRGASRRGAQGARDSCARSSRAPPASTSASRSDEYHADPSLGSTDLKRLLRSPADYWWES